MVHRDHGRRRAVGRRARRRASPSARRPGGRRPGRGRPCRTPRAAAIRPRPCTARSRAGRAPGRASSAAASASRSSWFPGMTCTGMASGASSSRTRSYSAGAPCWARSPVTTTASGAGSRPAIAATIAASLRAGPDSPSPAYVQVADLSEEGAVGRCSSGRTEPRRATGAGAPLRGCRLRRLASAAHAKWRVPRPLTRHALSATKTVGAPLATSGSVKSGSRSARSPRPRVAR